MNGHDAKLSSFTSNGMDADRYPEMGTWTPPTLLTGCLVFDGTFSTIIPFDRPPMTSYWHSVVIMSYLVSFLRYLMSKNIATLQFALMVNQDH